MALQLLTRCRCMRDCLKTNLGLRFYTSNIRQLSSKVSNILNVKKTNVSFTRTFFWQFFRTPSSATLKKLDNIPEHFEIIYKNAMSRYILSAQTISVGATLIIGIWAIYNIMLENSLQQQHWGNPNQPKPKEDDLIIFLSTFILFCTILQAMVHKMPLRIYNYAKKGEYVFVFYGAIPTFKRQVTCKLSEIYKINTYSVFPWKDGRIEIDHKQRVIVLEHFFRKPSDLNIMLGYQKPEVN